MFLTIYCFNLRKRNNIKILKEQNFLEVSVEATEIVEQSRIPSFHSSLLVGSDHLCPNSLSSTLSGLRGLVGFHGGPSLLRLPGDGGRSAGRPVLQPPSAALFV